MIKFGQYEGATLYSKVVTRKHWDAVLAGKDPLKTYCRKNGLYRQELILSVIKHFPGEWEEHKNHIGRIDTGKCGYCGLEFYANNPRQKFCNRWCYRQWWRNKNPDWRSRSSRRQQIASQDGAQDPAG